MALNKGDYVTQKVYNENPLEVAKQFEAAGIRYLHLVDLDGAKFNHVVNHRVLNEIAAKTSLVVDFGGGIKSDEDIRIAFENGASQIIGGSIAVSNRAMFLNWLSNYGAEKIILEADCKNRKIATHGWREVSKLDIVEFITDYRQSGIEYVICTDIAKDGMLQGTSEKLYREILQKTDVRLIASGGVSSLNDLIALQQIGCEAAIVGKAIYEKKITLRDLSQHFFPKIKKTTTYEP